MKKRITISAIVVLIVLICISFCYWVFDNAKKEADLDYVNNSWEQTRIEWFNEIKAKMYDESGEKSAKEVTYEYNFVNSISLIGIDFINVKIFADETGRMSRKFSNRDFPEEGEIVYDEQILLTKEHTAKIIKIIEKNDFWDIPTVHPDEELGFDGYTIFMEGKSRDEYNIISMWCPDKKYKIRKIYESITDCCDRWGLKGYYEVEL